MTSQYQKLAMAFFHPSLREDPFNPEDSARFFYLADQYDEALGLLLRHVLRHGGLSIIYGDVGVGKSSLMSVLRTRVRTGSVYKNYVIGEILDPSQITDAEFTRQLLLAFDQKPYGSTRSDLSDQFTIFLQRQAREGHVPLLLIDEGQCLSYDGLERLRIFLNYSLEDHRILQIVVFGQLELQEKIAKKRNLASRVRFTMTLEPLRSAAEVGKMIDHRLRTAGLSEGVPLFASGAIDAVFKHSGGIPRHIVNICSLCFDQAPMMGKRQIDAEIVEHVAQRLMQKGSLTDGR